MKNCDGSNPPAQSRPRAGAQNVWERLLRFLAHAFSVAPEGSLTEEDYALLDAIAGKVVQRGLASPVLLALHSAAPLGFISSQAMIALQPFADWIVPAGQYERFAKILERREGVEILMQRIEKAEADAMAPPPKRKI